MEVDTNVSESDVGGIKQCDKASFTVDAYPKRVFQGTVYQVRLSPQTVQNVVTYDAVVYVDNSDLALMPGMTASTQIIVAQRSNVLRVPDQALRYSPGGIHRTSSPTGGAQVYVLRDGAPVAVPVVVGLDDGSFSEIVSGNLHAGDAMITAERSAPANGGSLPVPRL
jgi:HlyD family secretion protein